MVALWCLIGLIISATAVSTLGAAFSIVGLRDLFSGAALAVAAMAIALEFSKFVLAAYLHQRWKSINKVMRAYMLVSVMILSLITSMGIYGFLSNAYQSASSSYETETSKLDSLKEQQARIDQEINRINKALDEIPPNRVTKKMQARNEAEPLLRQLSQQAATISSQVADASLKVIDVKQKVGPLIYISRAFNVNIDDVVKYLILVFVTVFDPLALCLVVATSEALESRKNAKNQPAQSLIYNSTTGFQSQPVAVEQAAVVPQAEAVNAAPAPSEPVAEAVPEAPVNPEPLKPAEDDQVIHMRFTEEADKKEG